VAAPAVVAGADPAAAQAEAEKAKAEAAATVQEAKAEADKEAAAEAPPASAVDDVEAKRQADEAQQQAKDDAERKKEEAEKKAHEKKKQVKEKLEAKREEIRKKAMKKMKEKKERETKIAEAGIPDKLENTGIEDMKLTNMRAAARLENHVMRAKGRLFRTQNRAIRRLQRSEGGTAARKAARKMRADTRDAIRKVQIQSIKMAIANEKKANQLKEQVIRNTYARQFRQLERSDIYANALHHLVANSWWHGVYGQAVQAAHYKCDGIGGGDARALCMQHVEENQMWLSKNLRSQDTPFQKAYMGLTKKYSKERADYLDKRKDLASSYRDELATLKGSQQEAAADHELAVEDDVRKRLMIHKGVDLGEDMETRPDDNDDESYQGDQPYHSVGDEESSDPSQVQAIVHEPGLAPDVNPNSDPDSAY